MPWKQAKAVQSEADRLLLDRNIYYGAETLRVVGILLQPFMPNKAAQMLDVLGVPQDHRTYEYARLGADFEYGTPILNPGAGASEGLFPPLDFQD